MPRPKVRPEDRQRAVKACLPCKASKKRCDAQQPCSNCVRKKSASTCEYAESPVRPRGVHVHAAATTSAQPPPSLEHEHEHAIGASDDEEDENENEDADAISAMPTTLGKRSRSPAAAAAQSSNPRRRLSGGGRLLLNSKGEKGKTRRPTPLLQRNYGKEVLNRVLFISLRWRDGLSFISAIPAPDDQAANGSVCLHGQRPTECHARSAQSRRHEHHHPRGRRASETCLD
jgi:type IV secretory pathway VirB10-like protein